MLRRTLALLALAGIVVACSAPTAPEEQEPATTGETSAVRAGVGAVLERHVEVDGLAGVALHGFGALENAYLALGTPSLTVEAAEGWPPVEQAWTSAEEAMEHLPGRHASLAAALLDVHEDVQTLEPGGYRDAELAFLEALEIQLVAEREIAEILLAHQGPYRDALERTQAHLSERAAGAFATAAGAASAYRSALGGFEHDVNAFNTALDEPESRRVDASEVVQARAAQAQQAYESTRG